MIPQTPSSSKFESISPQIISFVFEFTSISPKVHSFSTITARFGPILSLAGTIIKLLLLTPKFGLIDGWFCVVFGLIDELGDAMFEFLFALIQEDIRLKLILYLILCFLYLILCLSFELTLQAKTLH